MMEKVDKDIYEKELSATIGKAISQWGKKNGVTDPVTVNASVVEPDCYVDETGVVHYGTLVICNVHISESRFFDDDDLDDDDDY